MAYPDEQPDPAERAARWLERARLDYEGLKRLMEPLSDPPLAVYLLQQCVEKAVKALLVANGQDEATMKRTFSHNSLRAYLVHFRRLTDKLEPHFGAIQGATGVEFGKPTEDLRAMKATNFRSQWAAASSEKVRIVVGYLADLKRSISREVGRRFDHIVTAKGLDPKLFSMFAQTYDRGFANQVQRKALDASDRAEIREELMRRFDLVWGSHCARVPRRLDPAASHHLPVSVFLGCPG